MAAAHFIIIPSELDLLQVARLICSRPLDGRGSWRNEPAVVPQFETWLERITLNWLFVEQYVTVRIQRLM